jgi:hypothetical protein
MPFNIRMGVPDMAALWSDLSNRKLQGKLDRNEEKFFKLSGLPTVSAKVSSEGRQFS